MLRPLALATLALVACVNDAPAKVPVTEPSSASEGPPLPPAAAILKTRDVGSRAFDLAQKIAAIGPRISGSPGDAKMVEWAVRTLKENGLDDAHAEPVKVPHWERGAESAEIVSPVREPLAIAALGGSVATPAAGIEAEVVRVPNLEAIAPLDPRTVAGKIVFIDAPTRRAKDGAGYGESVKGRALGAREAQRLGALALLVRSIGTSLDHLPHTGAKAKDPAEIPAAALATADADRLREILLLHPAARVKLSLGARWLPEADSANVVADVRGGEKPGEIVVIGAHHDSWDLGTGAVDDGAGCAIAIEVGRLFKAQAKPARRTLRVVLFANEEHGRAGAFAYVKAHQDEAARTVAAFEADAGADRAYGIRLLGAPGKEAAFGVALQALAPLGVELVAGHGHAGADTALLRELGIPVLEVMQDASRYFDVHHSAGDTIDKIDPAAIAQAAASFALAAWTIADAEDDLGRVPEELRKSAW